MTWAEKADFDYYLNNVNLASFVAGSDRDGTINSPYVLFSDNKNEIRGTNEIGWKNEIGPKDANKIKKWKT